MSSSTSSSNSSGFVIITGASAGIGKAIARHFSEQGYSLLLLARRVHLLEQLNLPADRTMCSQVDVTDLDAFQNVVDEARKRFGAPQVIVNNAGTMLLGQVETQDPSEWKRMMDVNVIGLINGMRTVLQNMYDAEHGTIVNISSIAGVKTFPNHAVYCASKFAVQAVSEGVREEASAHNVRCVTVAPGVVETDLIEHTTSEEIRDGYKAWKQNGLKGETLTPDDVARNVLWAVQQPQHVCIREMVIGPTRQQP